MPNSEFNISIIGGMNANDQGNSLVARSFSSSEGQMVQVKPVESPDMNNIDFAPKGFTKRQGSLENDDLTGVMVANEELIAGICWSNPSTGADIEIIVGKKSIYTNQSGSWAQINNSASSAYTHSADVSKVTFAEVDNHLFIGLDGANAIQVYRSGADLDAEMATGNTYENAYGAGTNTITGSWGDGFYLVTSVHGRLAYSDGNTLIYYTPMAQTASSGVWDATNGGFHNAGGKVKCLTSFTPHLSDSLKEILYVGTSAGFEVLSGFDPANDNLVRIRGSKSPMTHKSFCKSKNWLLYLTDDKNIMAINGTRVLDLGRRAKTINADGPLDGMDIDDSTDAFAYFNADREQAMFHFSTLNTRFNDRCIVIDFKLGEPTLDESQESYEARVRVVPWNIKTPDTNDWFIHIYRIEGSSVGIIKTGKTYTINTLKDDLIATGNTSNIAIESEWYSPVFFGGSEAVNKQWVMMLFRSIISGNWPLNVDVYLNRSDEAQKTWSFDQAPDEAVYGTGVYGTATYNESITIKGSDDIDHYSEAIQWRNYNETSEQTFVVTNQTLKYEIGAEER